MWTRNVVGIETDSQTSASIGLEAVKSEGSSTSYGPFWQERSRSKFESTSITPSYGGPAKPEGIAHSYMMLKSDRGQWDLVYDFNPVGSTTAQQDTDPRTVTARLIMASAQTTDVENIDNRIHSGFLTDF
ncbi:hypothetical protein GCM10009799_41900 [Nocardiopsis rhodophaea]|uniref:Uncharacterized protein n=1 Tax=Nocardiopsis rhodophaea TaxID=280238 RepID=A0ABP5EYC6_9ACTN